MATADTDELLLTRAADRARALAAALDRDAAALREHPSSNPAQPEGAALFEQASRDASQLLRLFNDILHRGAIAPAANPGPETNRS